MQVQRLVLQQVQININNIQEKKPKTSGNICNNKFKVVTILDTTTLEYYQSIYIHCKQRFNISDGIKVVKKSNLTLALFSIVKKNTQYSLNTLLTLNQKQKQATKTNKNKQKLKQHSSTISTTSKTPKITAKYLQTPEQGTSTRLPLSQKPISTSTNIIDYLQENESNYSENLESKETESEQKETTENKEEIVTAYIAKIPKFTGKDNNTSLQEWLDKVQKAGDANGWNIAKILKAILYFLQGTTREWFENLEELFGNWQAFKDAFLQQFTNNNTSITF
ncbi:hypothetical protein G9A89_003990 [Geosiphon pyriformis]|nr:hypothetical protein G9A89_003990 [Geosiphon pyriformis]